MPDFIVTEPLSEIDPDVKKIIDLESERQKRKLIFIPSESSAPTAVKEGLGSILQNLYAEGYPPEESRIYSQNEILDIDKQITSFRRYSDPRYYKGVENADILEELTRRRCAELFSNKKVSVDQIYVNVQPLSGAPANNAVYHALINPGDVIIGMNLFHGGHLTHGSSVNRSGKLYDVYHYNVDPDTERINYETLQSLVNERNPKILIAGYSSYPWVPDWKKFAVIAHSVGAYLFADISHIAGMIAAGVLPSPVGFADVITFTTHKTLCGPRGACILSFSSKISRLIDKAVFPGEQGGPHINVFAGMATAFKLAKTSKFKQFQKQIIKNSAALCGQLSKRKIRIAFGGTDTHLFNIDCKSIVGKDGTPLSGDMAARILDIAGLVMNANTIPGDSSTLRSTGVRIGTPWITQRGLIEDDMQEIGNIIADILHATKPYKVMGRTSEIIRAKIDFDVLENAKNRVRKLTEQTVDGIGNNHTGYPNFYFIDDLKDIDPEKWLTFDIQGDHLFDAMQWVFATDIHKINIGKQTLSFFYANGQKVFCSILAISQNKIQLSIKAKDAGLGVTWLRDLSDGFIKFDDDLIRKIPGPFIVTRAIADKKYEPLSEEIKPDVYKPFFIGIENFRSQNQKSKANFLWEQPSNEGLKRTALYNTHKQSGAKIIPFAGWEMPVWYSSVTEEHQATRKSAGLFDVSHMGVFEASGKQACIFLNCVCANDISELYTGESCYTHLLDPSAKVIDDLLVYRHMPEKYLIVVNAANTEKDWAWLNGVKNGELKIDNERPWIECPGDGFILHNLHDESTGQEKRVDIALQGPRSKEILIKIGFNKSDAEKISKLKRTNLCHVMWENVDLIISRTGYTGEKMAFEIFIHPDKSVRLWEILIDKGKPLGLKPCGLGARDSLRTEAGLPLYGHEMGGKFNLGVAEAGFSAYLKTHKPWFIGRQSFLENENSRTQEVIRFRFESKHTRISHLGDLVFDERGKNIGFVTSCAIDTDEFLTGQAFIAKKHSEPGNDIYIYQKSSSLKEINLSELASGEKISLPSKAKIIRRFPKL